MTAEWGLSLAHTTILSWACQLYARFRQTLEPFQHVHRTIVACRRNVPEDARQVRYLYRAVDPALPDSSLHAARQTRSGSS